MLRPILGRWVYDPTSGFVGVGTPYRSLAELVTAARAEFDRKRGTGFVYAPLIGDRKPPLDYRGPAK